jgi:hypothetical protein
MSYATTYLPRAVLMVCWVSTSSDTSNSRSAFAKVLSISAANVNQLLLSYTERDRRLFSRLPPHVYLITLSARNNTDCGMLIPNAFAVLRLMSNSNFVGCSTGKSAGFVPFKILSTKVAARRNCCISLVE